MGNRSALLAHLGNFLRGASKGGLLYVKWERMKTGRRRPEGPTGRKKGRGANLSNYLHRMTSQEEEGLTPGGVNLKVYVLLRDQHFGQKALKWKAEKNSDMGKLKSLKTSFLDLQKRVRLEEA